MCFRYFALDRKRATKCKMKGITLNYENSKVVNFTTLRDMILENSPPVKDQAETWWFSGFRTRDVAVKGCFEKASAYGKF